MRKLIRTINAGFLLLLLFVIYSSAGPTIDAKIGFNGFHTVDQAALVEFTLSGLAPGFSGSLVLRQIIGNPWVGEGTMETWLTISAGTSVVYSRQTALVLHRSNHLFEITLYDNTENPVATWQYYLRPFARKERFPLIVGDIALDLGEYPVILAASALPRDWRAYGTISTIILGRLTPPLLNREQWTAISQWVHSGGRLVLFTGSDFFLQDSPKLRNLLPLQNPVVVTDTTGLSLLTGELRDNTIVELHDGNWPLLIAIRHGSGVLVLITRRSFDLSSQQKTALIPLIVTPRPVPAIELAADELAADQLGQMIVKRPSRWKILAVISAVMISFALIVRCMKQQRLVLPFLIVATLIITVLSGLYSNRLVFLLNTYVIRTAFNIQGLDGLSVVSYGLFTFQPAEISLKVRDNDLIQPVLTGRPPLLMRREDDRVVITMRYGERCYLVVKRISPLPIKFQLEGEQTVIVTNNLPYLLRQSFLIQDGEAYPLQAIAPGISTLTYVHALGSYLPAAIAAYWPEYLQQLFRKIDVDITTGTWLIGYTLNERIERWEEIAVKVRDISLYLVQQKTVLSFSPSQ